MLDLHDIENTLIDDRIKGIPGGHPAMRQSEIGAQNWNLLREDMNLPVAILKETALEHNEKWMARFLKNSGALLAPHGKTTMSPQLFARQLELGAWAVTVATVQQIQICRRFGVKRLILANQLVGKQPVRYVLDQLADDPEFEFYCLADSVACVETLAAAARAHRLGRPVNMLLEGGVTGGRTGCRSTEDAMKVARAIGQHPTELALCGVEGFEGLIGGETKAQRDASVGAFLDFLVDLAKRCVAENLFSAGPVILSAGGSSFYDLVVDTFNAADLGRETLLVTRSGCYQPHDSVLYRADFADLIARSPSARNLGAGLRKALQIWAYVQSRPEPGKILVNLGKRDTSFDEGLPVAEVWFLPGSHDAPEQVVENCKVVQLDDQHAHVLVPEDSPFQVGDMMGFGISHPCTTFDKWQLIYVVDDEYTVTSAVRTFF